MSRRRNAPRGSRKRRAPREDAGIAVVESPASRTFAPLPTAPDETRRQQFQELLALAGAPLDTDGRVDVQRMLRDSKTRVARLDLDTPDRRGGIDWHDEDEETPPERIPDDASPLDLARRTQARREREQRDATPAEEEALLADGMYVYYSGTQKSLQVVQRGRAASAVAKLKARFPLPPHLRRARPTLRPAGAGTISASSSRFGPAPAFLASGLADGAYDLGGGRTLHVHRDRARAVIEQLKRGERPVRDAAAALVEPISGDARHASDAALANRLIDALTRLAGRETPVPNIVVNVPEHPVRVDVQATPAPDVHVHVPAPPKPKAIRVETDSAGRKHYVPVEDEGPS